MPKSNVVHLGIIPEWWLWGIYDIKYANIGSEKLGPGDLNVYHNDLRCFGLRDGWIARRGGDLMDEDGFDDATSFPSAKPDRDLFGPPRRCRKQRGWHHVKRWPPVMQNIVPHNYITGAEIPQELFAHILPLLPLLDGWSLKDVGSLRLVCRYWDKLCLCDMFNCIALRGHQDLTSLLALHEKRISYGWPTYPAQSMSLYILLDPGSKVAENRRPWIDIALFKLLPMFNGITTGPTLNVRGPMPSGRRLTSVHLSSPCRSPWRPLFIRYLVLWNIRVQKLGDLVLMVRELPYLIRVSGGAITWDAPLVYPRATTSIPCPLGPRSDIEYEFMNSPPGLAAILSCALSLSGVSRIAQADADILYGLPSALTTSDESREDKLPDTVPDQSARRYNTVVFMCNGEHLPMVCVGISTHTTALSHTVQFMAFDFCDTASHGLSNLWSNTIFWDGIVDGIKKLTARPFVLLIFKSSKSAILFREHVGIPKMSRLYAAGKLKYVLQESKGIVGRLKLIEFSEGGTSWRVLAMKHYTAFVTTVTLGSDEVKYGRVSDGPGSWANALHDLITWLISHQSTD